MLRIQFRQNDRRFNINGNQDLLAHANVGGRNEIAGLSCVNLLVICTFFQRRKVAFIMFCGPVQR